MTKTWAKGLSLLFLFALTACGSGPVPPCGPVAEGSLAPLCSPPPPLSPVGAWEGTLTTTTGGSGTETFTATITETGAAEYKGVFTVGGRTYNVTGVYNGTTDEGDIFIFSIPLEQLQPTVSPETYLGLTWSGPMTEQTYSGGWFLEDEPNVRSQTGTFRLERRP